MINLKRTIAFVLFSIVIVVIIFVIVGYKKSSIDFKLIDAISYDGVALEGLDVKIIRTEQELSQFLQMSRSIDFDNGTVLISDGYEIKHIARNRKFKYLPVHTHFIKVFTASDKKDIVYVYWVGEKEVYFDERGSIDTYIQHD